MIDNQYLEASKEMARIVAVGHQRATRLKANTAFMLGGLSIYFFGSIYVATSVGKSKRGHKSRAAWSGRLCTQLMMSA